MNANSELIIKVRKSSTSPLLRVLFEGPEELVKSKYPEIEKIFLNYTKLL